MNIETMQLMVIAFMLGWAVGEIKALRKDLEEQHSSRLCVSKQQLLELESIWRLLRERLNKEPPKEE